MNEALLLLWIMTIIVFEMAEGKSPPSYRLAFKTARLDGKVQDPASKSLGSSGRDSSRDLQRESASGLLSEVH